MVRSAFNQGSYQGIRSLPNALKPDFRRQLYEKILEHAKVARQTRQTRQPGEVQLEAAVRRVPRPTAQGQWRPGKFSSVPSYFSVFEYMDDPIGRVKDCLREEAERSKKLWLSEEDFKTQALPPVPSHAGSFNEFEYAIDPFEGRDEYLKGLKDRDEQKVLHVPVRAGGCVATAEQTKIRANEAVESLRDTVGRAWPEVFVDAFQDSAGCLVLCFDRVRAEESGAAREVALYMNRLAHSDPTVSEFCLKKDSTRWGVADEDALGETSQMVYFVLWPPWVHKRPSVPADLQQMQWGEEEERGRQEEARGDALTPALMSNRKPFGPQTESGLPIHVHVRTWARSFKY